MSLSQLGCVLSKVDSYNFKYRKKNNSKIYILKLLKDKKKINELDDSLLRNY